MPPEGVIETVLHTIDELTRRGVGRLIAITLTVPPQLDPSLVVDALRARLGAREALTELRVDIRLAPGDPRILAAEYTRAR
ncbi:MAG TPA: hypothetical protein PKA64_20020 [Myxococcota bacterium]|nr:hypothetical protein [Myxococcota bacterium]